MLSNINPSHATATAHQQINQQYKLFPNPNDGSFVIQQYILDNSQVKIDIFDALGRNLYSKELQFANTKCQLNFNNYPPGLYLLEITDNQNKISRVKFVVNK